MKVILTHEVAGLGLAGDVLDVKDGYGRNYLLPQKLAAVASQGAAKQAEQLKRARQAREIRDLDGARKASDQLRTLAILLRVRAGESGRLYGAVTASDVAQAVLAAGGPKLDKRRVHLSGLIKSTGRHEVSVSLHPEVTAQFSLEIAAEK
ncbi:MAG: 50S ribosomal protein L9 [Acidimicrobiales bacterium]|nr:MAG: 50S ribosomal protein L9 [Acidimicrobiales bacterium]